MRNAGLFLLATISGFSAADVYAQKTENPQDLRLRPISVTTRVFQLRAKRGSYQELTDQVFKMQTANLDDNERWMKAFKKTYPGFDIALLRSEKRRVFRTSKPSVITLAKHSDGRILELVMMGAQSPGEGEKPGTSLIPEIGMHFGNVNIKPTTFSIQHLEVESGMTYFYAITKLKMSPNDYVKFLRPNIPAEVFDGIDTFLLFAFSIDLDKTIEPARYIDERQSLQLQEKATRKVDPEIPAGIRNAGLGGYVRVRVEISTEGKVTSATIHYSSFPEINNEALAAAREWEFPSTLFVDNKKPITGFIVFNFAAK